MRSFMEDGPGKAVFEAGGPCCQDAPAGGILEDVTEPADDALSLEMVTAALRLDSADAALYAGRPRQLALRGAAAPDYVTVERERSMSRPDAPAPGEISKVAVGATRL